MKKLHITMPDGTVGAIPLEAIAQDRAKYYAELDSQRGEGDYEAIYQDELAYTLSSDFEITDWVSNNMDWADLEPHAVSVRGTIKDTDYARDFQNADLKVVETE